jgi:hypothetical protein
MDMSQPIVSNERKLSLAAFVTARTAFNQWRVRSLEIFTNVESAVTETLISMAESDAGRDRVALPQLFGARLDSLNTALSVDGPFAGKHAAAHKALIAFREFEPLRITICHGRANVLLDQKGKWTAVIKVVALLKNQPVREHTVIEEDEAVTTGQSLHQKSQRLSALLGNVRKAIVAPSV